MRYRKNANLDGTSEKYRQSILHILEYAKESQCRSFTGGKEVRCVGSSPTENIPHVPSTVPNKKRQLYRDLELAASSVDNKFHRFLHSPAGELEPQQTKVKTLVISHILNVFNKYCLAQTCYK